MTRTISYHPLLPKNIQPVHDPVYKLLIMQSPINARESVKVNARSCDSANPNVPLRPKLQKRLIQPFPILCLKVYDRYTSQDITDHMLCTFFVRASAVELNDESTSNNLSKKQWPSSRCPLLESPHSGLTKASSSSKQTPEKLIIGTEVISHSHFAFPKETEELNQQDSTTGVDLSLSNAPPLSQSDYSSINSASTATTNSLDASIPRKDKGEGMFIFKFSDLGILKKGYYKLRFDLYSCELFSSSNNLPKSINKLQTVYSNTIKIYNAKEYYRKDLNMQISSQVNTEKLRLSQDAQYQKTFQFLKSINYINGNSRDPNKNSTKRRKASDSKVKKNTTTFKKVMNLTDGHNFNSSSINKLLCRSVPSNITIKNPNSEKRFDNLTFLINRGCDVDDVKKQTGVTKKGSVNTYEKDELKKEKDDSPLPLENKAYKHRGNYRDLKSSDTVAALESLKPTANNPQKL